MQSVASLIVSTYMATLKHAQDDVSKIGNTVPIPKFPEPVLVDLCNQVVERMERYPGVVPVLSDVVVVGDVHGNLHNILEVLLRLGFPPRRAYVFLGNFINFGEYSLETATLLFALLLAYPESVTVLRGITESFSFSVFRGLTFDVTSTYKSNMLVESFTNAFCNLPFAALVKQRVLCCQPTTIAKHPDLNVVMRLPRQAEVMKGSEGYTVYCDSSGLMSDEVVTKFVDASYIDCVITGDISTTECIATFADGVGISLSCCETEGYGCVLPLVVGGTTEPFVFQGIEPVTRDKATFRDIVAPVTSARKKGEMILKAVSIPKIRHVITLHHTTGQQRLPPIGASKYI